MSTNASANMSSNASTNMSDVVEDMDADSPPPRLSVVGSGWIHRVAGGGWLIFP